MDKYFWGNLAQVIGCCTLIYAYFPQIIRLVKNKSSQGINLQFWIILTIGLACVAVNMTIGKQNIFIQGTQWFNVCLACIVVGLSIKYRKNNANNN